ncbi:MAG TPA: VWA domain-containing protein [Candidatus Acidoferrum sp.]|nr:VWA domain-containing protein [Candidatus Acidoferrum sp.]
MLAVLAIGAIALTWVVLARDTPQPQTLTPGEVRLSSHPYVLGATLRAESRMVELEVVVRDSHGRAVPGLTKDDFAVYDSGKNRDLAAFSVDTLNEALSASPSSANPVPSTAAQPAPAHSKLPAQDVSNGRWIALLFDDLNTASGDLAHAKIAASRFIKEAARSGDRIAVFTTSGGRITSFTSDSEAILTALKNVQSHPRMSPGGLAPCPRITVYDALQIVNGDPTAEKAKVEEACACGGSAGCRADSQQDLEYLSSIQTDRSGDSVSTVKDAVRRQAQQTWDRAQVISQATLDAIKSSIDLLSRMPGTRMLLLASSGFISGAVDQQQDAIVNAALRANVVINSLDAKGLYAEAPGGPINESVEVSAVTTGSSVYQMRSLGDRLDSLDSPLARFAESTGGLLFRNNNDLDLGFHQLGLLPEYTYLLGFTPSEDGKWHKIKVELKNASHDLVQVRPGYFAPTSGASQQPLTAAEKMDALMRGSDEKTDLAATISEKLGTAASGERQLTVQAHIDIQMLPFEQQRDRHVQKLTFVAALFDSQGNFVTGKQADMELALKPDSFNRLSKTGINGMMQLEIPPGTYRLRMVVQEAVHGTLSATNQNLQVR